MTVLAPAPAAGSVAPMSATATTPGARSWRRAADDLLGGWGQRQLWGHLGWQDIRQRYRRSVLGPLWITISMAVTAVALGVLYAGLFGNELSVQLPYILVGFIVWGFVSGCVTEGSEVFTSNVGLIRHLPAPLSVHVYRLIWRQMLFFAHNAVVYLVMLLVFPQDLDWSFFLVFPALVLLVVNGTWVALLLGIVTTRFRDLKPITQSMVQLLFFLTPIVWIYRDLLESENAAIAERARLVEFNPLLHFVEIVRQPLLGEDPALRHWVVVLVITAVGWALALLALRRFRSRISYWV